MSHRHAVCYVASDGYLLQTALSALQAREHAPADAEVFVAHVGSPGSSQVKPFRPVFAESGVRLIEAPVEVLRGLPFTFARLFLPDLLPSEIDEILYLDGDTQVVDDLAPLIRAAPPPDGLIAVKDPMVFIHSTTRHFHDQVEGWWRESGIPEQVRARYVNSGVLRIGRETLARLRDAIALRLQAGERLPRFSDQDLINRLLEDRVTTVGLDWNFPGFLLGTRIHEVCRPRVVHFMSDPRPWEAPFMPWGAEYFEPYAALVRRHPDLAPAWARASGLRRARYEAQQAFKHVVERPVWQSQRALSAVQQMRGSDVLLE